MGRVKKICIGIVLIIVLVSIAGFFILPPIIKPLLIEKLSAALHRDVAIEKISFNPYTLSLTLDKLSIKERAQSSPFLSFDELHVNAEGLASLFKQAIVLKEIRLTRPYVNIRRHDDKSYNFSDLIPKEEKKPEEEKKPVLFSLNNIRIISGSIDFDDGPMKTRHTVREMNLDIPFISNIEHYVDNYVEPRFSAVINGDPYQLVGKTKPFLTSRETSFDLDVRNVDVPYYLNYLPAKMNYKLTSAVLDTKMNIAFIMHKDKPPALKLAGNVALSKVALDDRQNARMLRLPALNVDLASVEPLVPNIHLSKVSIQAPEIVIRRSKEGEINFLNIMQQETKKKPDQSEKKAAKPDKKDGLKARVDEFTIESAKVTFLDAVPAEPAEIRVAPLNLKATNLSTEKGSSGNVDLSLTVDRKGRISVKGPVGLDPLLADLSLDVKNLGIGTFQSYFTDKVKLQVTRGDLSTAGHLKLAQEGKGAPRVTYAGKISVSDFASIDKSHANPFLNWKQLYFDQLRTVSQPFSLDIKGVSLTDFYARIILYPDGALNLKEMFTGQAKEGEKKGEKETAPAQPAAETTAPAKPPEATANIKIGKVTFQGGTIDFADRFIKPNYSVKMLNMAGSVTGLSSEEVTRAVVDLRGNLGYGSPVEISGKINPLIRDLYSDMKLNFRDIELSPVTPYSSKYVGYPILKGKLTFDVAYLIDKRKLDAQNKIFIDQLTFGDRVESPDAIKVPVTLAVALLKDRNGQINLDIPVSGSLDDPQFSVWRIVWQVIVNLITKAATAPFTLLSSLFGGGEELSFIEFDDGSALVAESGQKKIQALAKALRERPALRMDIEGFVDLEKDSEGLKRAAFERKMKAQKLNDMIKKGQPAVPLRDLRILPQEYEKYLTLAYKAETFPKPRTVIGLQKSLPPGEMEKLILSHIEIGESDLRLLASRREGNVKDLLLKSGEIDSGRIFIVDEQPLSPQKKKNVKDSRVDFRLK